MHLPDSLFLTGAGVLREPPSLYPTCLRGIDPRLCQVSEKGTQKPSQLAIRLLMLAGPDTAPFLPQVGEIRARARERYYREQSTPTERHALIPTQFFWSHIGVDHSEHNDTLL